MKDTLLFVGGIFQSQILKFFNHKLWHKKFSKTKKNFNFMTKIGFALVNINMQYKIAFRNRCEKLKIYTPVVTKYRLLHSPYDLWSYTLSPSGFSPPSRVGKALEWKKGVAITKTSSQGLRTRCTTGRIFYTLLLVGVDISASAQRRQLLLALLLLRY